MAVNISGSILASLLYDHAQSEGHQMGFLTGEVVSHMTDTISDSQINNYEVETKIYVYGSVACPRDQRFYNGRGEILTDKLEHLLQKDAKNIIGWYSFRRNSTMRPSLLERLIHENLLRLMQQDSNHFVFLLCTTKASANKSTHSIDHSFSCLQHRRFQRKLMNVINLGDTTHTEYKTLPSHTASSHHGVYSLIVKQQEEDFLDSHGQMEVRKIQSLNGALARKLEAISKEVADSETKLNDLEEELVSYRKQVRLKMLEKQQQNSVPCPSATVPKKPSVDDILFMDENDSNIMDSCKPNLVPETTPKIEISKPQDNQQFANKGVNKTVKTEIKLDSIGSSSHGRSNSFSNPKVQTEDSINPTDVVHVRSKSADVPDSKSKGTGVNSSNQDPFSFVSGELKKSKLAGERDKQTNTVKSGTSVPSDQAGMPLRPRSQNSTTSHGTMKNTQKMSNSQVHSKITVQSGHIYPTSEKRTDGYHANDIEMDTESSDTCSQNVPTKKATLIGSKSCKQEVGWKVGVSDDSQSEESTQESCEMDLSSSPVY